MERKTYGFIEPQTDLENVPSYRDMIERRLVDNPEVALFSYTDYRSGKVTSVGPADFKRQREALSVFLHEQGLQRAHIGIIAPNSYWWALVEHAVVCSNNVAVCFDATLEENALLDLVKDCTPKAVIATQKRADTLKKINELCGATIFYIEDIEQMIDEGARLIGEGKDEGANLPLDVDACAFISYSSGTTGRSKGVMLSQRNLVSNALQLAENGPFGGNEVCVVPFNHLFGIGCTQLTTLLSGGTLHICSNLRHMYSDFADGNPYTLFVVPLLVQNMLDMLWKNVRKNGRENEVRARIEQNKLNNVPFAERRAMFAQDLSIFGNSLSRLISGGAPLPVELYEGWGDFGIHLIEGYGITECAPGLSINTPTLVKPGSVGRIFPGTEVLLQKPDRDGVGEVCVKGPQVMLGYLGMEQETAEAMEGGWFHTGDLGFLDEDLYLTICGRIKNLIILSNGENVSPEELENLIAQCPAVQEVIVYEKGDYIAAMIYPSEDEVAEKGVAEVQRIARAFVSELNKELTVYKRIRFVEFRHTPFQRTPLKKIKRTSINED